MPVSQRQLVNYLENFKVAELKELSKYFNNRLTRQNGGAACTKNELIWNLVGGSVSVGYRSHHRVDIKENNQYPAALPDDCKTEWDNWVDWDAAAETPGPKVLSGDVGARVQSENKRKMLSDCVGGKMPRTAGQGFVERGGLSPASYAASIDSHERHHYRGNERPHVFSW